ncbi:MAG: putative Ig domain-containing protein [Solirubrobacterales bacterium]|nr:putative Ig domain-containing protein [Solirubrobacterales bacterium]
MIVSWSAAATSTALSVVPAPNGAATFTATITPPPGVTSPEPTGTVFFHDGSRLIGEATLSGSSPDTAVLSTNAGGVPPGTGSFSADYDGDSVYSGSTSASVQALVPGGAMTTLSLSRTPGIAGQPETLTATVKPYFSGGPEPTGVVAFCGPPAIGCANVPLDGKNPDQATYTTTVGNVAAGTYPVSANYGGDSVYPGYSDLGTTVMLPVVVAGPLAVSTTTLSAGRVGSAYSATVAGTGGVTPYRWSLASGSLPAGLTLNPATGAITGIPTRYGTASFTVQATDSTAPTAETATRGLSLTVAPAPLAITTTALATGKVGSAYSAKLTATGGVTPYHWSVASGSLPAGLTLNTATGAITGTPTSSGTASFTVNVTDSNSPTATRATQAVTLTIAPAVQAAVFVTQGGYSGLTSYPLGANGNVSPYTDLTGPATGLDGTTAVVISPTGTTYIASEGNEEIAEYPYAATGNVAPTTTIAGGATGLSSPSGLALDSSGRLYVANYAAATITAYAPGASGNSAPMVTIGGPGTGLFGPTAVTFDGKGDLWVANVANNTLEEFAPGANGDVSPIATISGPDTGLDGPSAITLDAAGNVLVANTYGGSLTEYPTSASGDAPPLRTIAGSATGLSFPDGIDVDASGNIYVANEFAGLDEFAPTADGNAAPLDAVGGSATGLSAPGQIAVAPPLSVATHHLAAATVGARYAAVFIANLGTTPYRWRVNASHLPPGLHLTQNGALRGTPRRAGTYRFTVRVHDSSRPTMTARQTVRLLVKPARRTGRSSRAPARSSA